MTVNQSPAVGLKSGIDESVRRLQEKPISAQVIGTTVLICIEKDNGKCQIRALQTTDGIFMPL
jgi:hypothetical protein